MAKALIVQLLADTRQFGAELDRAAGKTRSFGRTAGVVGAALTGALAYGLEKSVKAAEDAQVSTARLAQAFKSSGQNVNDYAAQISNAESSGRNLGFTNIDVRDSLGSLEIATKSGSKAIKDLGVAEDIARFKHISLADASKVLTMTMAGSTRAAHMLGIQTQSVTAAEDKVKAAFQTHSGAAYTAALATAKLTDKQATAAQVVQLVTQKLGGQAQAFASTAQGGMAKMRAQTEALQENLGSALLPAMVKVTGALANLTGWFTKHTTVAKIAIGALAALATTLLTVSVATKLQTAATILVSAATKAWSAAQWLLNAALDANPIGIVVVALAALGAAIVIAWERSRTFRNIVLGAWSDIKAATAALVGFVRPVVSGMVDTLVSDFKIAKSVAEHLWDGVKAIWNNTIGAEIKFIIGLIKQLISIAEKAMAIVHAVESAAHTIGGVLSSNTPGPPGGPRGPGPRHGRTRIQHGGAISGLVIQPAPVVPAPKMGSQTSNQTGSQVHVHVGPVYGTVDADFAQRLGDQLATQLRGGRSVRLAQVIHDL